MAPSSQQTKHSVSHTLIRGIGIDIIEVERIRSASRRWGERFEKRIYTPQEIEYCGATAVRYQRLATRFAAKEATFKALGTGLIAGMDWRDVEIRTDPLGKPELFLSGKTRQYADRLGVHQTFVTLSHTENYAVANVILLGNWEIGK